MVDELNEEQELEDEQDIPSRRVTGKNDEQA